LYLICVLLGGFAFLPFLWTINAFWFFKEAFYKPQFEEQPQIRQCISHFMSIIYV
jgi:hypothetical protein